MQSGIVELDDSYAGLLRHVITPILERYGVPEAERPYLMAFYIRGLTAIIAEWLKDGCADSAESIIEVMGHCVKRLEDAR